MTIRILPLLLALCVLPSACGGSSSPTTPSGATTSTFMGTIAGGVGQTGTLSVTIDTKVTASTASSRFRFPIDGLVATLHAQSDTVTASGSLHLAGGSTTALTGTFNSTTKAITLSGGGFTFNGSLAGNVVSGTYSGPSGAAGGFASLSTANGAVTTFCGKVFGSGNSSGQVTGVFNLAVSNAGAISGTFSVPPYSGFITGQVNGSAFSITYTDPVAGASDTASGTIQSGSMSGVATSGNPFSGTTTACQ